MTYEICLDKMNEKKEEEEIVKSYIKQDYISRNVLE